jgi:DNA-binding response OmpR family regulator
MIVSVVGADAERIVSVLLGRIDARLTLHPDASRVSLVVVCDSDEVAIIRARRSSPDAAVIALTPTDPDGPGSAHLYAAGAAVVCGPEHPDLIVAHVRAILRRARWTSANGGSDQ